MNELLKFAKSKLGIGVILCAIFLAGVGFVSAKTTIGDSIITTGQLMVSGLAKLNGGISINDDHFTVDTKGKVSIKTGTSDNQSFATNITNSSNKTLLSVRNDGKVTIGKTPVLGEILPTLTVKDDDSFVSVDGRIARVHANGETNGSMIVTGSNSAMMQFIKDPLNMWSLGYLGDATGTAGSFDFHNGNSVHMSISPRGLVGIGTKTPSQKLEVNGGVRLNTIVTRPYCDYSVRGTFWFTNGSSQVADTVEVCAKGADGTFTWRAIF